MSTRNELKNGMKAQVRTGRHEREGIKWSSPFEAVLMVQKDLKGKVCGLFLQGVEFAEFDPRYHQEKENLFVAEDYVLEIISLV